MNLMCVISFLHDFQLLQLHEELIGTVVGFFLYRAAATEPLSSHFEIFKEALNKAGKVTQTILNVSLFFVGFPMHDIT